MKETKAVLRLEAQLGEGLHWDSYRQALWFVDIHGRRLFRWNLSVGDCEQWELPQRVGWVLPCTSSDAMLIGLQGGFAKVRPAIEGPLVPEWIARPFGDAHGLRLNDAKADASGAVWAGSMNGDDETRAEGKLFRLDPDGTFSTHDEGYLVANGPAIHPDGLMLLHTDSGRRCIYAFDLDAKAGRLGRKRVWRQFSPDDGHPDGMCFDADGCLWVAHWGAGRVSRLSANGETLREVALPVSQVTNVCFAGERLDRLFVTSASVGLSAAQRAREPLAGSLFEVVTPGTQGLPAHGYGG